LIATGGITNWQSVFATAGKSSGKWQFEIEHLGGTSTSRPFAAIADKTNASNLLATYAGNNSASVSESVGYWGNGRVYWKLSTGSSEIGVGGTNAGMKITIALDLTLPTPEAKFYRDGVLQLTRALPVGKTWFPMCSLANSASQAMLHCSGLEFPVSGFSEWDS